MAATFGTLGYCCKAMASSANRGLTSSHREGSLVMVPQLAATGVAATIRPLFAQPAALPPRRP
jgi:hypothetical protein